MIGFLHSLMASSIGFRGGAVRGCRSGCRHAGAPNPPRLRLSLRRCHCSPEPGPVTRSWTGRKRMTDGDVRPDPSANIVSAARDLVPLVLARCEEAEQRRRLPPDVAEAFAAAGLLQMYLPRSMGGPELPPLTAFEVIETISRADGA